MRRHRMVCGNVAAVALAAVLMLAGCGGSSGTQAGGGQATEGTTTEEATTSAEETAGEEATAADTEATLSDSGIAVGDEPGLTTKDVAGIYLLDTSTDAIIASYQLKQDGAFVMRIYAAGSAVKRVGTYEIRDDKVYVNVPEGESGTINVQGTDMNISANALEDVEVTIEDGVLTSDGIGSGVTAHKISSKEYRQRVAKADELAPRHISVGETVSADGYTFTVDSFEFRDEVYPSDTSGYYTYFQHEDDHDYLVADVTYTNDWTEYQSPGAATAALASIGENNYTPTIEVDGGSRTSSSYSIDPKDTGRIVVVASIPDAAREEGAEVKLTWVFPKDPSLMNHYFRNESENVRYILTL